MEIHVSMRETTPGRWRARVEEDPPIEAFGSSRTECLIRVRRLLAERIGSDEGVDVIVEVTPLLAGVAEAAEVMGWDKRRVITYMRRGRFPEPIQALASGRVWRRADLEEFAERWRASRARRAGPV